MRIFILIVNYTILTIGLLALLSLLDDFNFDVILGAAIMIGMAVPNIIYAHMTKPVDTEKEKLKQEIADLKKSQQL